MRNVCRSGLVLLVCALGCKVDPLPQRDFRDGSTEAGGAAGIDSRSSLDTFGMDGPRLDSSDSAAVELVVDSAMDSRPDLPLIFGVDAVADQPVQAGPEAMPAHDASEDVATRPGPELAPDGALVTRFDAGVDVGIDGGKDAAADTPLEVGPDSPPAWVLAVAKTGTGKGGLLSSPPGIDCGSVCSASFTAGTIVTLSPAADATSTFVGWAGSCSGPDVCTVTIDAAKSAIATFDVLTQGLSVAKTGAGDGAVVSSPPGINCGSACASNFPAGTRVILTATPDGQSVFIGWAGVCTGIGACALPVDQPRSVTAIFVKAPGAVCTSTGQCQTGLTCLDNVCCTQAICPQCRNCGAGGLCNATVEDADDSSGAACNGTNTCNASGACAKRNGETCGGANECASGTCTDNRCCRQSCGTCQACTGPGGTCVALTSTDDLDNCTGNNTCDAVGACKKKPGQVCGAGAECGTGNCLDGVCCTQLSCPQCQNCGSTGTCSISVTSADDTTGATCSGTNTCDVSGACKKSNGQTCSEGTECASGRCPNNVCCAQSGCPSQIACGPERIRVPREAMARSLASPGGTGLVAVYDDGDVRYEGPIDFGPYVYIPGGGAPSYYPADVLANSSAPVFWQSIWSTGGETLTGYIVGPRSGLVTFSASADDYISMNLGNGMFTMVSDNQGEVYGSTQLEAGVYYPVTIDYRNRWGSNFFRFYWQCP